MKRIAAHHLKTSSLGQSRKPRLEPLEERRLLAIDLVADINQTGAGGDPSHITVVGNTAYFAAFDQTRGVELWKTDGTVAGTRIVKDIFPGSDGDYPHSSEPRYLTNFNGTLYFSAFLPESGRELWKSDGTIAGTTLVKDIWPGVEGSGTSMLTKSGGLLYFSAFDPLNGSQLWESDGTAAGTVSLTQNNFGSSPTLLTDVAGALYFVGEGSSGQTLYRTTGGTPVAVPIPLAGSYSISELEKVDGILFFTTSSAAGNILWRTNGTTTTQVAALPAGFDNRITFLTNANGTLYGVVGGNRLYSSASGSPALIATFPPGNLSSLVPVGNKVFFTADDGVNGRQLWVSAGTSASTQLVKVIGSGTGAQTPSDLANVDGVLYFSADDGVNGRELWKSDGTAAGTKLVEDLAAGPASSTPRWITSFNGLALFQATGNQNGSQLFKSNGTVPGTFQISNLNPLATADAFPSKITDVGGLAYFFADDGIHGRELWKSDGTSAGTSLVADIRLGAAGSQQHSSSYAAPANVNGTLYFVANDGVRGAELWKSDASGTSLVRNIAAGAASSNPANLTAVGGVLYFTANDGVNGTRLWKSNGTTAGTVPLGPANSSPVYLTNVSGVLFFTASDGVNGFELWKTNGTPAGTLLVRDIRAGSGSSRPNELTNVNGTLFFSANDEINGAQLWKSNGTAAGTVIVRTITPGFPHQLTNVNGALYFAAVDAAGTHLWKSDGTAAGTTRVLGENPSPYAQYPAEMTNVGGVLMFTASDSSYYDRALWRSDGTAAGTLFIGGAPFSDDFTAVGSTLYFTVRDGRGEVLWKSDGTAAGTVEIQVFGDGSYNYGSHYPSGLTNVGGRLFFAAGDLQYGNELRVVNETVAATSQRSSAQVMEESKDDAGLSAARLKQEARQVQPLAPLAALTTALPKRRWDAAEATLFATAVDSAIEAGLGDRWQAMADALSDDS